MIRKSKENIRRKIENFETMPVPEIEVKRERGIELLAGFLSEQKETIEDNEEALYMIALTYNHPERKDEILNQIKKHKSFIENPEKLYEKTVNNLRSYEKNNKPLNIDKEIEQRKENIPIYKERIKTTIEYFRPDPKTSDIKNVEIIPCDKLLPRINTGRAIHVGTSRFIMSHTENPDNFDHEFLHGIINPITEKLEQVFSNKEKQKILDLAGNKLKRDYGDYSISLLNEEIIRTYNDLVKQGKKPESLANFQEELKNASEENFKEAIKKDPNLRKRLTELNIKNLNDFRAKSEIYHDGFFEKDELRERLFGFYKKYETAKEANKSLSFEKYFSENYKKILD